MELELAASTVTITDTGITVGWSDGRTSRFHALWLRDNCSKDGVRHTGVRTFSVIDLNPELFVLDAERDEEGDLVIEFSDGHESTVRFAWLEEHSYETHDRVGAVRQIEYFRAGSKLEYFDLPRQGTPQHLGLLDAVARDGVAIVNGIPSDAAGTEMVASLFGCVRETEMGRLSDVVMQSVDWEFSDEGLALDPHTRDAFRYAPPGVSITHCVEASAVGGEWVLVDGFAVATEVGERAPDAFDLLTETSVAFVRRDDGSAGNGQPVHLKAHARLISLDRDREIGGVRFDEQTMASLDIEPRQVGEYYRALITFTKAVHDPSRALQVSLDTGQAIVCDNHRVLQGRAALGTDGAGGHVRVCAVDRDQFHSRLRQLRAQHEQPHVDERLPGGSSI